MLSRVEALRANRGDAENQEFIPFVVSPSASLRTVLSNLEVSEAEPHKLIFPQPAKRLLDYLLERAAGEWQ